MLPLPLPLEVEGAAGALGADEGLDSLFVSDFVSDEAAGLALLSGVLPLFESEFLELVLDEE